MSDQSKEPPERNNPSQATPKPKPAFIIRHDQAVEPEKKEQPTRGTDSPQDEAK